MKLLNGYIIPYFISNGLFLISIYLAYKKPFYFRILFILLFLGAFFINFITALNNPDIYLEFGELSFLPIYKDIISGFFKEHIRSFISTIAFLQFILAIMMALNNTNVIIACLGGIIFGLAIAPLGVGSAFPSTLFMVISLIILIKKYKHNYIWKWHQYKN